MVLTKNKPIQYNYDNYGAAVLQIVEVLTELLTSILAYNIFDIYVICYHHYMTFLTFKSYMTYVKWHMTKIPYGNMGVKIYISY